MENLWKWGGSGTTPNLKYKSSLTLHFLQHVKLIVWRLKICQILWLTCHLSGNVPYKQAWTIYLFLYRVLTDSPYVMVLHVNLVMIVWEKSTLVYAQCSLWKLLISKLELSLEFILSLIVLFLYVVKRYNTSWNTDKMIIGKKIYFLEKNIRTYSTNDWKVYWWMHMKKNNNQGQQGCVAY